jgi:voltage-gated potassium channel
MYKTMYSGLRLFKTAFMNTRRQICVSGIFLVAITCVLTVFLYLAESRVDPNFSFWDAFIWPYEKYLGDPGKVVDDPLISPIGKLIATLVGIMGVAIFAVPAGLIGSGLTDAMDEEKREKELEEFRARMRKSFRRVLNKKTQYRVVPRRVPVISLQAKKGMSEKDVIDTVSKFKEFRLRNLAASQVVSEHPQDRLVIELLPLDEQTVDGYIIEHTDYGIKIDRDSNVTIITPSAATENSIGHVGYYLAQFGGFNYVSREFVTDVDEPVSYYKIEGERKEWEKPLQKFVDDIKPLSEDSQHWNIILVSSDNVYETQFHFVHRAKEETGLSHTTLDEDWFLELYAAFSEKMKAEYEYLSDMDQEYKPVGNKNIGVITGGGTKNNAITLRISYSVTTWSSSSAPIIVDMAKVIKQYLEKPERNTFEDEPSWKDVGCGYGTNKN